MYTVDFIWLVVIVVSRTGIILSPCMLKIVFNDFPVISCLNGCIFLKPFKVFLDVSE
jgi:hypothetical protein